MATGVGSNEETPFSTRLQHKRFFVRPLVLLLLAVHSLRCLRFLVSILGVLEPLSGGARYKLPVLSGTAAQN